MSPSLQVISESKEAEVDQHFWKIILLAVLGVATSAMSVSGFNRLLLGMGSYYMWATLAAFIAFLIFTLLQIFLIKGIGKLLIIAFLDATTPLLFFSDKIYPQTSLALLIGAAVIFVFLFSAFKRGIGNLENSMTVRFFENSRRLLPRIVTGFLLFFSILLYLNYFEWGNFTPQLGKAVVENILTASEPIVKVLVPDISFKDTANNFFKNMAKSQLKDSTLQLAGSNNQNTETQFRYLSPRDQDKLVGQVAAQLQKFFMDKFGSFNPNDKVTDVIFLVIEKYLSEFAKYSPWALPFAASLLLLTLLKSVFVLLYWLIAFLAFVLFKILLVFNFAHITSEAKRREFTLLS